MAAVHFVSQYTAEPDATTSPKQINVDTIQTVGHNMAGAGDKVRYVRTQVHKYHQSQQWSQIKWLCKYIRQNPMENSSSSRTIINNNNSMDSGLAEVEGLVIFSEVESYASDSVEGPPKLNKCQLRSQTNGVH